jgi:hypothetical protein
MSSRREPQEIEQCIGCGNDVAVWSERQKVDGEVFCSSCRRIHRGPTKPKRGPVIVPPTHHTCSCSTPCPAPDEPTFCVTCFYDISV